MSCMCGGCERCVPGIDRQEWEEREWHRFCEDNRDLDDFLRIVFRWLEWASGAVERTAFAPHHGPYCENDLMNYYRWSERPPNEVPF